MRRMAVAFAVLLVTTICIGVDRAPAQTAAGWVPLIGKDLSNWDVTGNADWKIANGVIEATKARGFLLTKDSYTDFDLRGEVWALADSNGGFLFRITDPKDPGLEPGYEFHLND